MVWFFIEMARCGQAAAHSRCCRLVLVSAAQDFLESCCLWLTQLHSSCLRLYRSADEKAGSLASSFPAWTFLHLQGSRCVVGKADPIAPLGFARSCVNALAFFALCAFKVAAA